MSGPGQVVYVAPMGRAHWPDPIGVRLAAMCSGAPIRAWDTERPQDVPPERRCRHGGCRHRWGAFDAERTATSEDSTPPGGVTDPG